MEQTSTRLASAEANTAHPTASSDKLHPSGVKGEGVAVLVLREDCLPRPLGVVCEELSSVEDIWEDEPPLRLTDPWGDRGPILRRTDI
jgi:hypothetical protein